jgi:hypothetical protein
MAEPDHDPRGNKYDHTAQRDLNEGELPAAQRRDREKRGLGSKFLAISSWRGVNTFRNRRRKATRDSGNELMMDVQL